MLLPIAIAQFRPDKGDYPANLARMGEVFREVGSWAVPPAVVVAPEAALTGYFLEGGVQELALPAEKLFEDLGRVHRDSGAPPLDIAIGFYELWRNHLHNSALYASLGGANAGIRHVHRKVFLPTYGVFDEERFVEPGRSVQAFDTAWGRAAMLVCEDAWHSLAPTLAALDGAQVLLIPSATPARGLTPRPGQSRPANLDRWDRLAQGIAEEHGIYVVVAHLVGFEGGKGFVGGSVVAAPRGALLLQAPVFEPGTVPATLDFEEITRARAEAPLLSDLQVRLPHLLEGLTGGDSAIRREGDSAIRRFGDSSAGSPSAQMDSALRGLGAASIGTPSTPGPERTVESPNRRIAESPLSPLSPSRRVAESPLDIDPALTRRWLVEFIRDEIQRRRKFGKVVIGLSGGVDSALVTYLAAEALGPEDVIAVRMPYRSSSPESLAHAQLVIDALGVESRTVDISSGVDGIVAGIGGETTPARKGNIMARMRMITLFDLSAAVNALPLGTGNKTERLFGYFTWHADDSPPVNPIGDLFKTQVWALARHMGVPDVIVTKPASADLITGQTDEGDFGISYSRADVILHWLLQGYRLDAIAARGFTLEEVALVERRLESTHWKRRLPTVAMLSQTAIGEYYLRPVDY